MAVMQGVHLPHCHLTKAFWQMNGWVDFLGGGGSRNRSCVRADLLFFAPERDCFSKTVNLMLYIKCKEVNVSLFFR